MACKSVNDVAAIFRASVERTRRCQIGAEIERIGILSNGTILAYEGGAEKLLDEIHRETSWKRVSGVQNRTIGLETPFGKVSLEPGSQFELSVNPCANVREVKEMVDAFDARIQPITDAMGLRWLSLGLNPFQAPEDISIIPSERYHIMTDYLPKKGKLATSMMRLSSSIQVNLDYHSEEGAITMLRTALAAAPLTYALFANSPILKNKRTGFLSFRAEIWRNTDPDRCGLLAEAFEEGFDFQRYAEIVWRRPLMFVQDAQGRYVKTEGMSLDAINHGALPGVTPSDDNLMNAVRELFFEARLKPGYIEVRSIDGLPPLYRYGAIAFWAGLLYSQEARETVLGSLRHLSARDRDALWVEVSQRGLEARFQNVQVRAHLSRWLELSKASLQKLGKGDEIFLEPLFDLVGRGKTLAEDALEAFDTGDRQKFLTAITSI